MKMVSPTKTLMFQTLILMLAIWDQVLAKASPKTTQIVIKNNCPHTIWPATLSGNGAATLANGGLALSSNSSVFISAPHGWSGRFWARTGCVFNPSTLTGKCTTGDCGGSLHCSSSGQTPATLAEFTLGGEQDFYDVSLVDGYNLPIGITPRSSSTRPRRCKHAGCVADLNKKCPAKLRVKGKFGETVACQSACTAFGTPEYCCTGEHGSPSTCKPTRFSRVFKKACPTAYSYAYDDATSTFTCSTGSEYHITFCP